MVLNLFSPLYRWLPGFARRVFCPLYLRDAAVYERNQQALQVKMAVEIEWRTRLQPLAKPGATQAGARTANAIAALKALQCGMAPRRLCSLRALPTLQRQPWFAALFSLEQVATSQVPRQVEWVHRSSLPSASTRLCCSSYAGAATASLHCPWLRAWSNHKVCRALCPMLNTPTHCLGIFGETENGIF